MSSLQPTLRPAPLLPGHWIKGSIEERRQNPLAMMQRLAELGDVAQFRAYWVYVFQLSHPDALKHVLVDKAANYRKGVSFDALRPLLGNGLLTAEGELWMRNRRLAQPAFHRERLAKLVDMMVDATDRVLTRWDPAAATGAALDVAPDMMGLTMSVVARALFSADVTGDAAEVGAALTCALEETNRRLLSFNPIERFLPTQRNRDFARAMESMNAVVNRIIGERRAGQGPADDLLGMLMAAKDQDTGESMSDAQLRDEAMTLFLAGHETTAVALCWMWYLLSKHPEIQRRVRAEVAEVLGNRVPTSADLPRLKYLSRCWDETLRLYPPVWVTGRETLAEDEIMGFRVPARTVVSIPIYTLHHNPRFWDQPEVFDPDRFTPERSQGRPRHAYLPFGGGQRLCIGNNFAIMEAQVIAARVLQRFELAVPEGYTAHPEPLVTLRPQGGMPLILRAVDASGARLASA
ncbi:MAG: cytochrome P450 [Myxococcota bacterium]|nr:cytochrome P450 [Myxococcota bacterium]